MGVKLFKKRRGMIIIQSTNIERLVFIVRQILERNKKMVKMETLFMDSMMIETVRISLLLFIVLLLLITLWKIGSIMRFLKKQVNKACERNEMTRNRIEESNTILEEKNIEQVGQELSEMKDIDTENLEKREKEELINEVLFEIFS